MSIEGLRAQGDPGGLHVRGSYSPCLLFFLSLPHNPTPYPSPNLCLALKAAERSLVIALTEGEALALCLQGLCLGAGHGLSRAGDLGLLGSQLGRTLSPRAS